MPSVRAVEGSTIVTGEIAAVAKQHGLTLVSRDAHFQQIEGLLLEAW